ncbi:MAG: DUF2061 domain-containing protein [Alphaproteobacteria bacterium]|nr:DUF2061 domain-containing protein [Alphaproteobacteria bacterium]
MECRAHGLPATGIRRAEAIRLRRQGAPRANGCAGTSRHLCCQRVRPSVPVDARWRAQALLATFRRRADRENTRITSNFSVSAVESTCVTLTCRNARFRPSTAGASKSVTEQIIAPTSHTTQARSLAKTFSWRALASVDTFILGLIITGSMTFAGSIATLEVLTKLILYYLHERAWARVAWGVKPAEETP